LPELRKSNGSTLSVKRCSFATSLLRLVYELRARDSNWHSRFNHTHSFFCTINYLQENKKIVLYSSRHRISLLNN